MDGLKKNYLDILNTKVFLCALYESAKVGLAGVGVIQVMSLIKGDPLWTISALVQPIMYMVAASFMVFIISFLVPSINVQLSKLCGGSDILCSLVDGLKIGAAALVLFEGLSFYNTGAPASLGSIQQDLINYTAAGLLASLVSVYLPVIDGNLSPCFEAPTAAPKKGFA